MVLQALRRPRARPLVVVDLAVPRVVEPSVGTLPGVILRNVDDLPAHDESQGAEGERRADQIERLVAVEVEQFCAWWESRDVVPTIRSLVRRAADIRKAEVAQAMRRLGHLDERDRATVDALGSAIVRKLLHLPITRLKGDAPGKDRDAYVRIVHRLFGLDEAAL